MPVKQKWICTCGHKIPYYPTKKREKVRLRDGTETTLEVGPLCPTCGRASMKMQWIAIVHVKGERSPRTYHAKPNTKDEAWRWELETKAAIKTKALQSHEENDIDWALAEKVFEEDYLNRRTVKRNKKPLSEKTKEQYRTRVKLLRKAFETIALQDMTEEIFNVFIDDYREDHKNSTVDGLITVFKLIYTTLGRRFKREQYRRLHVALAEISGIGYVGNHAKSEIFLHEQEEWETLLRFCNSPHLYHFVFGILSTGLRNDDMLKLRISEINFATNEIVTVVKNATVVEIPIVAGYRAYLLEEWLPFRSEWVARQKVVSIQNDLLIPRLTHHHGAARHRGAIKSAKQDRFTSGSDIGFKTACLRAAEHYRQQGKVEVAERFEKLTPHGLRHTFATHFLYSHLNADRSNSDGVVKRLSLIMGHTTTFITDRYIHILRPKQHEAMAVYGENLFSAEFKRKSFRK